MCSPFFFFPSLPHIVFRQILLHWKHFCPWTLPKVNCILLFFWPRVWDYVGGMRFCFLINPWKIIKNLFPVSGSLLGGPECGLSVAWVWPRGVCCFRIPWKRRCLWVSWAGNASWSGNATVFHFPPLILIFCFPAFCFLMPSVCFGILFGTHFGGECLSTTLFSLGQHESYTLLATDFIM